MNEPKVKSRWTQRDESMLAELIERKRRITDENMAPVKELCNNFSNGIPGNRVGPSELADWLVGHADSIRDALEPFDSGVRAGGA